MAKRCEELKAETRERAARIMRLAWRELPADHRRLLEEVGASQWLVLDGPLGMPVNRLLRSAGTDTSPSRSEIASTGRSQFGSQTCGWSS